jgi:hypothetical protein
MKKLATSVDTKNREVHGVYELSSYVNYYSVPGGTDAVEIPANASYIQLSTTTQGAWFKLGGDDVTAEVPSGDIEDGTSATFIPANSKVTHRLVTETHLAVVSAGGVIVSYWSQ